MDNKYYIYAIYISNKIKNMQIRNMQMMLKRKSKKREWIHSYRIGKRIVERRLFLEKLSFDFNLKRRGRRRSKKLIEFGVI